MPPYLKKWEEEGLRSEIEPMDLFIVRSESFYGRTIRKLTGSLTNHNAMVFDHRDTTLVLECSWPVNRVMDLEGEEYFKHLDTWRGEWLVVRPKHEFSEPQKHLLAGYLMGFNYTRYALRDIWQIYKRHYSRLFKWLPFFRKPQKGKVYCTESVTQAYALAGFHVTDREMPSPIDLEEAVFRDKFQFVCGSWELWGELKA